MSRLPHQRLTARDALMAVEGIDVQKLFRVFDQAFNVHLDYRFQSIEALHSSLVTVEKSEPQQKTQHTMSDRIAYLKSNVVTREDQERLLSAKKTLESIKGQLESTLSELFSELGNEFHRIGGDYSLRLSTLTLGYLLGVVHELTDTRFTPKFTISIVGTEVLIAARDSSHPRAQPVDLLRLPLSDYVLSPDQKTIIKEYFLQGLEAAFSQ